MQRGGQTYKIHFVMSTQAEINMLTEVENECEQSRGVQEEIDQIR